MGDMDSGQRTTALVAALWRALWMWRWFVQPAIVWFGGAKPRGPPHRRPPPLLAHFGGGGKPASVWWWDHGQCRGSDVRHGVAPVLWQRDQEGEDGVQMRPGGGMGASEAKEGGKEAEASKGGSGLLMGRG